MSDKDFVTKQIKKYLEERPSSDFLKSNEYHCIVNHIALKELIAGADYGAVWICLSKRPGFARLPDSGNKMESKVSCMISAAAAAAHEEAEKRVRQIFHEVTNG
jgi:hypothetical protein